MQLIIDNEQAAVQAQLNHAYRALQDLSPLMGAIGSYLEGSTRQRFYDKTAPSGSKWGNLLPSTQAKKGNNNRLIDSGDLLYSLTHEADRNSVSIGTPELYGIYHQLGTRAMAARPFLGLSHEDIASINDLINDYLEHIF